MPVMLKKVHEHAGDFRNIFRPKDRGILGKENRT